jgi:hypothetical protein
MNGILAVHARGLYPVFKRLLHTWLTNKALL